ncbi:MAG TPA: RNA-binding cell elongation regulator Jag/EloR [Limnochordales bacterium]
MSAPRSVVKSGRNVEEALEAALDELGVERDEVIVEVLEEANKGLLSWLGGRLARVRVTVKHPRTEPEPDLDGRADPEPEEPARGAASDEEGERARLERGRAFVREVIRLMGIPGAIETRRLGPGAYHLNVVSERAGLLIGHRGQTLNALQYLANVVANRGPGAGPLRLVLDAGDYRRRREAALRQIAQQAARRARQERRRVALEPMTAAERRIVHLALKDDPAVETRSEGEEPNRRVVIFPKEEQRPPEGQRPRGRSTPRRAEPS